jgi:hypothetical protein
MKPSEALEKSIDIIDQYGWIQGNLGSDRCGWCLIGAVNRAVGRADKTGNMIFAESEVDDIFKGAVKYVYDVIEPADAALGVANWNDTKGRTKHEVRQALMEAQHRAELAGE